MDKNKKEIIKAIKIKSRILRGRDQRSLDGTLDGEKIKEIDSYIKSLTPSGKDYLEEN